MKTCSASAARRRGNAGIFRVRTAGSENTSLGTDHGTANHMYLIGKPVKGRPLRHTTEARPLAKADNLVFTTDSAASTPASSMAGWLRRHAQAALRPISKTFPHSSAEPGGAGSPVRAVFG